MNTELLKLVLKKGELTPIQKFRFETTLTDKFGRDGLRVYFLINGANSIQQISTQTGLDERRLLEILKFIAVNQVVSIPQNLLEEPSMPPTPSAAAPSPMPAPPPMTLRSPTERKTFAKFGQLGVDVFRQMDYVATPAEILERIKITEQQLIEILKWFDAEGIAKLQKPEEKEAVEAIEAAPTPTPAPEPPAAPMQAPQKEEELSVRPIYMPIKRPLGLFARLKLEADLLMKYGQRGMHIYSLSEGGKTTIKLAKETRYPAKSIDEVLDFLAANGGVDLKELSVDDIRERYGEEGVAIYDVYGREGILIYEFIDKRTTIKDIILNSHVPPRKGVEIFAFIHKILGLDIPLDKKAILKQFGIAE